MKEHFWKRDVFEKPTKPIFQSKSNPLFILQSYFTFKKKAKYEIMTTNLFKYIVNSISANGLSEPFQYPLKLIT